MRRTLFATTAVASMIAFGALAQQATDLAADAPATTMPADPAAPAVVPEADTAADGATPVAPSVGTAPMDAATADGPVLTPVIAGEISADKLMGASIQTMAGENIATVNDVLASADGNVENIVAQFGGFLGFGSNTVLLTPDEITVMQDEAGNYVVETALTPESLEGRPDYQPAN